MLCINVLPNLMPRMIDVKLSSVKMISPAAFATSVPEFIANPTSALANAGESLVPSPVIATDIPVSCAKVTNRSFVLGAHRAITFSLGRISLILSSFISENS